MAIMRKRFRVSIIVIAMAALALSLQSCSEDDIAVPCETESDAGVQAAGNQDGGSLYFDGPTKRLSFDGPSKRK